MTKFDHRVNLPEIFKENDLAILPVTRGDYMISTFDAYQDFEPAAGSPTRISVPAYLESLDPQFLVSESIALNCAYASGILQDFLGDDLLVPTVSGRMGSGDFSFRIASRDGSTDVSVHNAQIEIDAAYEGRRALTLFEAKRDLANDFLVRQLYYPFRAWSARIVKPVHTVFLVFSNGSFHLYRYEFDNPASYNSLQLTAQKTYVLASRITRGDIERLMDAPPLAEEPTVPFPQANSMDRVVNLTELLYNHPMTRDDITSRYAFDARQTNYYTDAARYLGLVERFRDARGDVAFRLTADGCSLMRMPYRLRQLAFADRILQHRAFRESFRLYLAHDAIPDADALVRIMHASRLYKVEADTTYRRRASTVAGWIDWIAGLIG